MTTDPRTLEILDEVDNMTIQSAWVPTQDLFLTLVLRDGRPFDLAVSKTHEEAIRIHEDCVECAKLIGPLLAASAKQDRSLLN